MFQTYLMNNLPLALKKFSFVLKIYLIFLFCWCSSGYTSHHVKFDVILDALIVFSFHGICWHMVHHICLSAISWIHLLKILTFVSIIARDSINLLSLLYSIKNFLQDGYGNKIICPFPAFQSLIGLIQVSLFWFFYYIHTYVVFRLIL
jgi:hypothetical protein